MVEKSENKFKANIMKYFGNECYIKKMPDFRQIGDGSQSGMPDYLVIHKSNTLWFEVKKTMSAKTFNLDLIRESQWIEFNKMTKHGAKVFIALLMNKHFYIIEFNILYDLKFYMNVKSIKLSELNNLSVLSELVLNDYK